MSFQARDGTWVRSRPEMRIANWLNLHGIEYEYEPSVEGMRPDFQVVGTSILIEYWGGAGFRDYAQRMEAKIAKYEAAGYDVVSLFSVHLWELDRVLADEMSRRGLI